MPTLRSLMGDYAEILNSHFSEFWEEYSRSDSKSPVKFITEFGQRIDGTNGTRENETLNRLAKCAQALVEQITQFWEEHEAELREALTDAKSLTVQVGDSHANARSYLDDTLRLGIYSDIISVVDPFYVVSAKWKNQDAIDQWSLVQVLTNYLCLRLMIPLFTSATRNPIAIVVPYSKSLEQSEIRQRLQKDSVELSQQILQETFEQPSEDRVIDAIRGMTADEVTARMRSNPVLAPILPQSINAFKFLGTAYADKSVGDLLLREDPAESAPEFLKKASEWIFQYSFALSQAELEAFINSTDWAVNKSSWDLNQRRILRLQELGMGHNVSPQQPGQAAILSGEMEWLSAVTIDDLVHFREGNVMDGLRELFNLSQQELQQSAPSEIQNLVQEVRYKIEHELRQFIADEARRGGIPITKTVKAGSLFAANGALALSVGSFSPVLGGLVGAAGLIYSLPAVSDVVKTAKEERHANEQRKRSPIALMAGIYKRENFLPVFSGD